MANETFIHNGFITNGDSEVEAKLSANTLVAASLNYPTSDGGNGQVMTTDGSGNLTFAAIPSGVTTFAALNDTDVSSLSVGDILKWDGSDWVSQAPSFTLAQISDFDTADYATGAEGDLAATAVQPADIADFATETYVDDAVSDLIDAAPGALDTLNELAAAIGDDANFSTTITNQIAAIDEFPGFGTTSGTALEGDTVLFDGTWSSLTGKPSTFAPSAHTHTASEITDFSTAADARIAAASIDDLSDVDTTTNAPANGDVMVYDGSNWVPRLSASLVPGSDSNTALTGVDVAVASGAAAVQVDYVISNGTSVRAGIIHAVTNGSVYEISDMSTVHAGTEAAFPTFSAMNAGGGNLGVQVAFANGYTVKYTVQNLVR